MPVIDGYDSPEPGDLPEKYARMLGKVYSKCRKDNPDYSKERCSKIAWGAVNRAKKSNTFHKIYQLVKKQLASYRTTVNGDNPHYHYYEIDSEGNGQTSCTIATDKVVITIDPHDHKISKWKISSAKKHTHGMDVIEKSANGKKATGYTPPSQSVFKAFEKYHRALKGYYKPIMGSPINKSRINKSYLEKVMGKVLKTIVNKSTAHNETKRT